MTPSFCFAPADYEGHWLFETPFLDSSNHLRHLDPLGGTSWVNGAIWGDGISAAGGYIAQRPRSDAAFDFSNLDFTLMTWARRTSTDSYLMSKAPDHGSSTAGTTSRCTLTATPTAPRPSPGLFPP